MQVTEPRVLQSQGIQSPSESPSDASLVSAIATDTIKQVSPISSLMDFFETDLP